MAPWERPLWVVGAGGFGREVVSLIGDLARSGSDVPFEGVVDDAPEVENVRRLARLGAEIVGDVPTALRRTEPWSAVVAIGDPEIRQRVVRLLTEEAAAPVDFPVLVHPAATVGDDVVIAEGTVVAPGVRLSACISVGRHVHLDQNVTVGHDTVIGDFSRLNPAACVSGNVHVGRGVIVGANSTVLQGLVVNDGAVVGAGAVVTRDVNADRTVIGVPARPID